MWLNSWLTWAQEEKELWNRFAGQGGNQVWHFLPFKFEMSCITANGMCRQGLDPTGRYGWRSPAWQMSAGATDWMGPAREKHVERRLSKMGSPNTQRSGEEKSAWVLCSSRKPLILLICVCVVFFHLRARSIDWPHSPWTYGFILCMRTHSLLILIINQPCWKFIYMLFF